MLCVNRIKESNGKWFLWRKKKNVLWKPDIKYTQTTTRNMVKQSLRFHNFTFIFSRFLFRSLAFSLFFAFLFFFYVVVYTQVTSGLSCGKIFAILQKEKKHVCCFVSKEKQDDFTRYVGRFQRNGEKVKKTTKLWVDITVDLDDEMKCSKA